jgi:uncharacterized membrane protein YhhN
MRSLLWISLAAACGYLALILSNHANGTPLSIVLKVASTGLLLAFAENRKPSPRLLVVALAFSVLGDFLLEIRSIGSLGPMQLFLLGLISFLVAHLFYIALFLNARSNVSINLGRTVAAIVIPVCSFRMLLVLWPNLAEMRWPVVAYSLVLTIMTIAAQLSRFRKLVPIGALLFFASDTMLAMSIFGHPFSGSRPLVWITYYAAQLMITLGVFSVPGDGQTVT